MSQIERIFALPDWKWKPQSEKEIQLTGSELIEMSDFMCRVGNVAVAGFIYESYTSPPWMWFALADGVSIADLIDFRRVAQEIPKGTLTAVESTFKIGLRFAQIYGFVDTGKEVIQSDRRFKIMRKI